MRRRAAAASVACCALVALVLAASPATGHGASEGLHLHVEPDPAPPGAAVVVSLDAREPLTSVRVGRAGDDTVVTHEPDPPARHVEVAIRVPEDARDTVSLHAEATAASGATLRASAILRIGGTARSLDARAASSRP